MRTDAMVGLICAYICLQNYAPLKIVMKTCPSDGDIAYRLAYEPIKLVKKNIDLCASTQRAR